MPNSTDIAADPRWLPHAIDAPGRRMQFVFIERDVLSQPGFLADHRPQNAGEVAWLPWQEVAELELATGSLHFIFHTAFCRSTLLVRAVNVPGAAAGLGEPGILAALANLGVAPGQPGEALLKPVLCLLARSWGHGEAVFVKPTNHANMLMPALMRAMPQARAILMTNPLEAFLASVLRKGMMGRRWGRQLYLELQGYAGMDFGMDGREQFGMTDLQAAGLGWFLNQRWFAMHAAGRMPGVGAERFRVLDGDRFNAERECTLRAAFAFIDRLPPDASLAAVLAGPVFAHHAKLGGVFAAKEATDTARSTSPLNDEEIAQVAQWIEIIARQAGVTVPVRQTLF